MATFPYGEGSLRSLTQPTNDRSWRILTVKRSPKIVPAASAVRGIATLREHTVSLKVEGVKNSKKSS